MDIDVVGHIGEWTVACGGRARYHACRPGLFGGNVQLHDVDRHGVVVADFSRPFWALFPRAEVRAPDGRLVGRFVTVRGFVGEYRFDPADDSASWTLVQHRGRRMSLHAGRRQIATGEKSAWEVMATETWRWRADDDIDVRKFAIAIVAWMSGSSGGGRQSTITFDFGNIGPEARPFDETWEPRRAHDA